jgi:hypothetical protein
MANVSYDPAPAPVDDPDFYRAVKNSLDSEWHANVYKRQIKTATGRSIISASHHQSTFKPTPPPRRQLEFKEHPRHEREFKEHPRRQRQLSPMPPRPQLTPMPPRPQLTPTPPQRQLTPTPPQRQLTPTPPQRQLTPTPPQRSRGDPRLAIARKNMDASMQRGRPSVRNRRPRQFINAQENKPDWKGMYEFSAARGLKSAKKIEVLAEKIAELAKENAALELENLYLISELEDLEASSAENRELESKLQL